MRGKQSFVADVETGSRSIPACAGETVIMVAQPVVQGVYPRVCGGNPPPARLPWGGCGLSPRVRGKPNAPLVAIPTLRSIPACAGETYPVHHDTPFPSVYPRVCGGNIAMTASGVITAGLSPRVRGKPIHRPALPDRVRSIPACAGETTRRRRFSPRIRVYPRVCGGNRRFRRRAGSGQGLSPRVRGKPLES